MKCQVCDRDFAAELSICPKCGAMINDTVREELAVKVTPSGSLRPSGSLAAPSVPAEKNPFRVPPPATKVEPPKPPAKVVTAQLRTPKTSQTLVDFQSKNAPLPDWRLQMQNAVRARRSGAAGAAATVAPAAVATAVPVPAEKPKAETPQIDANADPRLSKALKRIAESRESFPVPAPARPAAPAPRTPSAPDRSFPFDVVTPSQAAGPAPERVMKAPAAIAQKPKLVTPIKVDTSKLDKIDLPAPLTAVEGFDEVVPEPMIIKSTAELEKKRIFIPAEKPIEEFLDEEFDDEEIEDLAPVSMRFNSGLFDLIICAMLTMVILSPFAFSNTEWFTVSSVIVFAALFALTTFVYSTVCTGFYGRTMGMKIFGLEIVDADENEYPTLAQAAVNSALYLGSLGLAGLGFIAMLFNEERRALHDLMSGTIVVRQF
jgi:uncharacterized RDD family membrane protein YckC